MSRKDIPKSKYCADIIERLLVDSDMQTELADSEEGGSHITARLELEAAEEIRQLRAKLIQFEDRDQRRLKDMQKRVSA